MLNETQLSALRRLALADFQPPEAGSGDDFPFSRLGEDSRRRDVARPTKNRLRALGLATDGPAGTLRITEAGRDFLDELGEGAA